MAKKKTVKAKKKSKRPTKKKVAKKKKPLSAKDKKRELIATFLQEIYHLTSHSIEDGTEAEGPWHEIMSAMLYLHNQLESNEGHTIREAILVCGCDEKQHKIQPAEIVHECESELQ
jgi:hypothetical protein